MLGDAIYAFPQRQTFAVWTQLAKRPSYFRIKSRNMSSYASTSRIEPVEADEKRGEGFVFGSGATAGRRTGGDWAARREEKSPYCDGSDRLAELGKAQDYNINVDHGELLKARAR